MNKTFSFENVVKQFGEINKALYGVNPFAEVALEEEPGDEENVREGLPEEEVEPEQRIAFGSAGYAAMLSLLTRIK